VTDRLYDSVNPNIGTVIDASQAAIAAGERPSCSLPNRIASGVETSTSSTENVASGSVANTRNPWLRR